MAASSSVAIPLSITWNKTTIALDAEPTWTLHQLQLELQRHTSVPPFRMKLLVPGRRGFLKPQQGASPDTALLLDLISGARKITMLGSTAHTVDALRPDPEHDTVRNDLDDLTQTTTQNNNDDDDQDLAEFGHRHDDRSYRNFVNACGAGTPHADMGISEALYANHVSESPPRDSVTARPGLPLVEKPSPKPSQIRVSRADVAVLADLPDDVLERIATFLRCRDRFYLGLVSRRCLRVVLPEDADKRWNLLTEGSDYTASMTITSYGFRHPPFNRECAMSNDASVIAFCQSHPHENNANVFLYIWWLRYRCRHTETVRLGYSEGRLSPSLSLSPDGTTLALTQAQTIVVKRLAVDRETGYVSLSVTHRLDELPPDAPFLRAVFSSDSSRLIVLYPKYEDEPDNGGGVRRWTAATIVPNWSTGTRVEIDRVFSAETEGPGVLDVTATLVPGTHHFFALGRLNEGSVGCVYEVGTGRQVSPPWSSIPIPYSAILAPTNLTTDGSLCAVATTRGFIVFRPCTGEVVFQTHGTNPVRPLCFMSPSILFAGRRLALDFEADTFSDEDELHGNFDPHVEMVVEEEPLGHNHFDAALDDDAAIDDDPGVEENIAAPPGGAPVDDEAQDPDNNGDDAGGAMFIDDEPEPDELSDGALEAYQRSLRTTRLYRFDWSNDPLKFDRTSIAQNIPELDSLKEAQGSYKPARLVGFSPNRKWALYRYGPLPHSRRHNMYVFVVNALRAEGEHDSRWH